MASNPFTLSMTDLRGPRSSTILITGGSSGIGLETAITLHEVASSNNIVILDRSPLDKSIPKSLLSSSRFLYHQCDITSWPSQRGGFEAAVKKFGAIDHVFVNAGIYEYKDQFFSSELDQDGLLAEPDRRVVDIDLNAANDTVKLAIHYIRNRQDGKKGGSIVLTASLAGYLATGGAPLYSAAKHGLVGLMRSLKNNVAKLGIAVSVIAPGITATYLAEGTQGKSLEDWANEQRSRGVPINTPREVAIAVVWLFSQGLKSNGRGLLIQAGSCSDVEAGIATSRRTWMSAEQYNLFRDGSKAILASKI